MKYIKSTGILTGDEFTIKDGWISTKGMGGIASPFNLDFHYEHTFLEKRDVLTQAGLKNNQKIILLDEDDEEEGKEEKPAPIKITTENKDDDDSDDSDDDEDELKEGKEGKGGRKEEKPALIRITLENKNEIVLAMSEIRVLYDYPLQLFVVDKLRGFKGQELCEKIAWHYKMIIFLSENYDLKENKMLKLEEKENIKDKDRVFQCCGNRIESIIYHKEANHWEVQRVSYW